MKRTIRKLGLVFLLSLSFRAAEAQTCKDLISMYVSYAGYSWGVRPWIKAHNLTIGPVKSTAAYIAAQDPMVKNLYGGPYMEVRWHNGKAPKVTCVKFADMYIWTANELTGSIVEIPWPTGDDTTCDATQIISDCPDGSGGGGSSGGTGGGDGGDTYVWVTVTCYWYVTENLTTGEITSTFLGCYY